MTCIHTQTTNHPIVSGRQQQSHWFGAKGLQKSLDRSKRCFKSHKYCLASSSQPPDACVASPESSSGVPSCEVRNHLEQLYQLEHPQSSAWFPSALLQEGARRGVHLEEAGILPVQLCEPPPDSSKLKDPDSKQKQQEYYANLGDAIRVLREETPYLFQQDLTYDIYRDDIVFRDNRNVFLGKKNYKTIFWSLRFHGRLFFSRLTVRVSRIWQPEESMIKLRWTVRGVPRVPWEAEGVFDGISEYKLDRHGKIYEHKVTNIQMRDPPLARSPLSIGLNMIPVPRLQRVPQTPVPGGYCQGLDESQMNEGVPAYLFRFSWVRLYAALLGTVQLLRGQRKLSTVLDM